MSYLKIGAIVIAGVFAILVVLGSGEQASAPATDKGAASATISEPRAITADDKTALAATVEEFGIAMKENDFDRIVGTIPAPVMTAMAEQTGLDEDKFVPAMKQQMETALASIEIVEFGMDTDSAELKQAEDGLIYAVVDTRTVMQTADDAKLEARTPTLAVMDAGKWHLLRVDSDQQKAIIAKVYPSLKDVSFPASIMEPFNG